MNKTLLCEAKTAAIKPRSMEHTPKKPKANKASASLNAAPLAARPVLSTNIIQSATPAASKLVAVRPRSPNSAPPASPTNAAPLAATTVASSKENMFLEKASALVTKGGVRETEVPKKKKVKKSTNTPLSPGTSELLSQGLREAGGKKAKTASKKGSK
jgi:hypothetical protein